MKELQEHYISGIDGIDKLLGSEWRTSVITETLNGGKSASQAYDYAL